MLCTIQNNVYVHMAAKTLMSDMLQCTSEFILYSKSAQRNSNYIFGLTNMSKCKKRSHIKPSYYINLEMKLFQY